MEQKNVLNDLCEVGLDRNVKKVSTLYKQLFDSTSDVKKENF